MKTTKKAMNNIEEVSNQFALFCQYIETHKDGELVKHSDAYDRLKRKMMNLQNKSLTDNLI